MKNLKTIIPSIVALGLVGCGNNPTEEAQKVSMNILQAKIYNLRDETPKLVEVSGEGSAICFITDKDTRTKVKFVHLHSLGEKCIAHGIGSLSKQILDKDIIWLGGDRITSAPIQTSQGK